MLQIACKRTGWGSKSVQIACKMEARGPKSVQIACKMEARGPQMMQIACKKWRWGPQMLQIAGKRPHDQNKKRKKIAPSLLSWYSLLVHHKKITIFGGKPSTHEIFVARGSDQGIPTGLWSGTLGQRERRGVPGRKWRYLWVGGTQPGFWYIPRVGKPWENHGKMVVLWDLVGFTIW